MWKLGCVILAVAFFPLPGIAAVMEKTAAEPDCEVEDRVVAHFIGKPWSESPALALGGSGKVWFAARIERNKDVPCGFIYSYLVRNIGETEVFASWELPFRRVPLLISVPVRGERHFSFRRDGQPTIKTARARVLTRTAGDWNDDPTPKVEKLPVDAIFWDWDISAAGTMDIFIPQKLLR